MRHAPYARLDSMAVFSDPVTYMRVSNPSSLSIIYDRTLHTKEQRFLFSKRHLKKFSAVFGVINRVQQSSLTSKRRLN